ncbi:MAG: DUF4180 domain-containing protein [Bacteroidales bacterium]|nr:DUF4180 domain-containing protein [Bacteroidales bacterium]MBN2764022.1 DUF4180 domain-containing protein [Bacteroidales bacterium]
MELKIYELSNNCIAELISPEVEIREIQDALDMIADAGALGAGSLVMKKENLTPDFFDLSTGIAGEILQKFSTYAFRLAIVGDFSEVSSKSLKDFIYESNKRKQIVFVESVEDAVEIWFGGRG